VAGRAGYAVPRHRAPIELRLDGNEGIGPPEEALEALAGLDPCVARFYPDARPLEARMAATLRVAPSEVIVTCGADDALLRAFVAVLAPGREVILHTPTFEMLHRYAAIVGGEQVLVPWPGGAFPVDAVLERVSERTALVVIVSPNNPTGAAAAAEDVHRVARGARHALVLVDLAYDELADRSLAPALLGLPNVVGVKTLSKAWGLAGMRVGLAFGPAEIIAWLRAAGNPYPVSGASLIVAERTLAVGVPRVHAFAAQARRERARLSEVLKRLGAEPEPSQANFVLARFADARWTRDALAGLGISVRIFPDSDELRGCLRITCPGEPVAFERLEAALEAALAPQALLLDMDGVLADVSQSYRRAIVETAASFGVELTPAEVARAKAEEASNNDWVVTRRLLEARGVEASLEEVTRRFEALVQGSGPAEGLWRLERSLAPRALLERLASRLPLGVVTGRPRADARRFLEHAGIGSLVRAMVCLEDAPLKPDPAPVRLALERLGARRAWMVGDSPDDIRAARAAGVVAIGVVAPGDDPAEVGERLERAGAARVLGRLEELQEMLP
jgi:histidinol-phosphate aminotransferase